RGGRGRGGGGGPSKPPPPITHPGTISTIVWNTVRGYRDLFPNPHRVVFDDYEYLFTPDTIPIKEAREITLHGDHPGKEGKRVDIRFECLEFFDLDLTGDCDSRPFHWTSIFVKNLLSQRSRYIPAENTRDASEKEFSERFANSDGGLFFIPRTPNAPKVDIQPGVEAWLGLYASVRRMENFDPVINYGLVNKLFVTMSLDLVSFYLLIMNERIGGTSKDSIVLNSSSCMTPQAMLQFDKHLQKIKLKSDYAPAINDGLVTGRVERHYQFVELKLNSSADREYLKVEDGRERERVLEEIRRRDGSMKKIWKRWKDVRMDEWYAAQGMPLKYPKLPVCVVKTGKREDLLPMEVLITHDTPQKYMKMLSFYARMRIPRLLARSPVQHHRFTNKMLTDKLEYEKDPFMEAMRVSLDPKMIECEGRVVEPCTVLGKNDSDEKFAKLEVKKETGEFFVTRAVETSIKRIRFVVCKVTDAIQEAQIREFYRELVKKCVARGLIIPESDYQKPPIYRKDEECANLARMMEDVKGMFSRGQKEDEVLVFLFFTKMIDDLYGEIKFLSDIHFGVVSQVIDEETVRKACTLREDERPSDYLSIYHHLCLKLNAKLGGVNQTVEEKDEQPEEEYDTMPSNQRTMFIGIDVIHPSPNSPIRDCSLAAIVASMDKNAAKYAARIKVNSRCNENVQLFDQHFSFLLEKYHAANGFLPDRIVILRDGVSDSEMVKAASQELNSIKEAWRRCANEKKCPPLTYIVAQKRHKTRFYKRAEQKEGNVTNPPMGTVVDKDVVTPHMFDFYMVSHHTLVGTSRPIHYTVVYDDCKSGADDIQELVFRLCFLYARCSKPVSLPAPVYYAHLACERAAFQHEYALSKGEVEEIKDKIEGESDQQYATRVEGQALRIERKLQVSENHPGMYFI
ncbi:hypothetical protein PMAYCL1PPCAC_00079, partial [Pristionchus mayeri]